MKKWIFIVVCLVGLLCACAFSVSAVSDGSLSATNATGAQGETVTVWVKLDANPGLITMKLKVVYPESLELAEVKNTGLLNGGTALSPDVSSPYTIRWADALASENNTATGEFVRLTFKIKDSATPGNQTVTIDFCESWNAAGEQVHFEDVTSVINVQCANHTYTSEVTAPTCTESGFTAYNCTACGANYIDNLVSPVGHSYVNGLCAVCGASETSPIVVPTIKLDYPTLSFEDQIQYNVYFTLSDPVDVLELGLITFDSRLTDGTIDNAVEVIPGYVDSGSGFMVHSNGIPAKNLGDALYFKVYAKLSDGSYVYSDVAGYHAVAYAKTVLNSSDSDPKAKALVVAMLNYGAAAQVYFGYKTDMLMNASLTAEQQALVQVYDGSMVADVVKADPSKAGFFIMDGGYSKIWPTVSFEGAFSINFYFAPNKTVDASPTFYYWDAETYAAVDVLTPANATGVLTMAQDGANYSAAVEGIVAKSIDETVYVAGVYTSDGVSYPTDIIAYSLGNYCKNIAANGEAFGAATAVYGYYAKTYFEG